MKKRINSDTGIYLILSAVFAFLLLSLCALALGLGFIHTNRSHQQAVGDLIVLGALDEYLRYSGSTTGTVSEAARRNAALARANDLLDKNPVPGMQIADSSRYKLGLRGSPGAAGTLLFGRFHNKDPGASYQSQCKEFPCWEEVGTSEGANALRLKLANEEHPISAPFSQVLRSSGFLLNEDSTVSVVETCGAYLLDVSLSTVSQSHQYQYADRKFPANPNQTWAPVPAHSALFAFLTDLTGPNEERPLCGEPVTHGQTNSHMMWCNIVGHEQELVDGQPEYKLDAGGQRIPILDPLGDHIHNPNFEWEQYVPVTAYFGYQAGGGPESFSMMVDSGTVPEPMRSFYLAINAGLRLVNENATVADRAMFRAFTGDVFGRRHPVSQVLTTDLDELIDLTNMNRFPSQVPNFATQGWLPLVNPENPAFSGTSHVKVLYDTIVDLVNNCPAGSKKFIVLATDGVSTCRYTLPGTTAPAGSPVEDVCVGGQEGWRIYWESENRLLTNILDLLTESKIALTVLLDGQTSFPHYRNVPHPTEYNEDCKADEVNATNCYLDFVGAQEVGLDGMPNVPSDFSSGWNYDPSSPTAVAECESSLDNSLFYTCRNSYQIPPEFPGSGVDIAATPQEAFVRRSWYFPNVQFTRPIGVFGHMAIKSGGRLCPMLNTGKASDYVDPADPSRVCSTSDFEQGKSPCVLKNSVRDFKGNYGVEFRSLEYLNQSTQAAKCIQDAIGSNRYLHVEPFDVRYVPSGDVKPEPEDKSPDSLNPIDGVSDKR